MKAELLLQMLKETDDPVIRQQIAEEFPADPELKGVFEKSYRGYLQAAGEERKKPKILFRMSHAVGIAACMVLVVGAYLLMRIPQERIPSIPEEPTTETIGMTLQSLPETSGELPGTVPTDMLPTDMIPAETEASSDMTESSGESPESVTAPPMTDPVESTAETSVTGDMPEETGTIASSEEETAASIATTAAGSTTAATVRTTAPTEAPITGTTEETIEPTIEFTEPTAEDEGITTPETTVPKEQFTEPTANLTDESPECTESTENPTEDTTTTTTTTTADYGTLPGYAVTVNGTLTTVTHCNPVAASPSEMGEYTLDAENFTIRFQGTKGSSGNPYNAYAVLDPNRRSLFFYQYKRTEFRRNFGNVLSLSPDTVNGHPAYWVITKGKSPDNPDHTLVWDDGLYTFVVTKEAQYSGYLHEAAEAFYLP